MIIVKYVERLRRIDAFIAMKATGNPKEFAEKLGIKRSTLYRYLQELKLMGVEIKYSSADKTYYYANDKRISFRIEC